MRQLLNSYTYVVKMIVLAGFLAALSFVVVSTYGDTSSYIDDYERVRVAQIQDSFDDPDSSSEPEFAISTLSFGKFQLLISSLTTYLTVKKAVCSDFSLSYRLHARAPPLL